MELEWSRFVQKFIEDRRKNMKVIREEQAEKFKYAKTSSVLEYSIALNEKNIDCCINTINGRYPETGYCSNYECEELCYILEGKGRICERYESSSFQKGDVLYIAKKDVYYWEGNCKILMICTPAWFKEQCRLFEK